MNPFRGDHTVEIMSLELAEQVANNGVRLTTRDPRIGRAVGSPLLHRDDCIAVVVMPRVSEGDGGCALALVVDTKVGQLVWVNPANGEGVTPLYFAAAATLSTAELLQMQSN